MDAPRCVRVSSVQKKKKKTPRCVRFLEGAQEGVRGWSAQARRWSTLGMDLPQEARILQCKEENLPRRRRRPWYWQVACAARARRPEGTATSTRIAASAVLMLTVGKTVVEHREFSDKPTSLREIFFVTSKNVFDYLSPSNKCY